MLYHIVLIIYLPLYFRQTVLRYFIVLFHITVTTKLDDIQTATLKYIFLRRIYTNREKKTTIFDIHRKEVPHHHYTTVKNRRAKIYPNVRRGAAPTGHTILPLYTSAPPNISKLGSLCTNATGSNARQKENKKKYPTRARRGGVRYNYGLVKCEAEGLKRQSESRTCGFVRE